MAIDYDKVFQYVLDALGMHLNLVSNDPKDGYLICCNASNNCIANGTQLLYTVSTTGEDILPVLLKSKEFSTPFAAPFINIIDNPFYGKSLEEIQIMADLIA